MLKFKKLKNLIYLLKKIKYKVKTFFYPYNVIKIRDMKNEWYDVDHKIFFILKQLLIDFVETEKPFIYFLSNEYFNGEKCSDIAKMQRYIDELEPDYYQPFDEFQKHKNELQELLDLYKWFKVDYVILLENCDNAPIQSLYEEQLKLYEEQTKKLIQLVTIRGRLWT